MSSWRRQLPSILLFIVALAVGPDTFAGPGSFSEACKRWSALAPQGPSRPVSGLRLQAGHLEIELKNGSVVAVAAGSEVVGLYFVGSAGFTYLTADTIEFPVVSYNLKKNTDLQAVPGEAGLAIRGAVSEVLWLARGAAVPALPTEGTGRALDAELAAHVQRFGRIQETPPAQRFAAWPQNGGGQPLVRAQLATGTDSLVYVFDPVDLRAEGLYVANEIRELDRRAYLATLSEQPLGRLHQDPMAPRLMLTEADLAVTASDGKDVAISVTETYTGIAGQTGVLVVSLYDTTYGRSNQDLRHHTVKGIFDERGTSLPFDHTRSSVAVELPAPIGPGTSVKLRFEIEGDILVQPGGDSYWLLGTEPWFPQPDIGGQYCKFHTTVRVKKPFVPFAPGKTVRRVEEGEYNLLETRLDKPVQFMVILAGKYSYKEETADGVTVRVASYAGKNTLATDKLLNLSRKMITYYEGFLGPFPFEEYNIIEINDLGYGQAPPAFMFITSEAFNPIGDELNELFSKGINERIAHEIAHQYWGHVVKMSGGEEQWLSESFAEMSAGLLIKDLRGKSDFKGLVAVWKSRAKEASEVAPIPLAYRISSRSDSYAAATASTYLVYFKGAWLLNSIREQIGDHAFLVFLSSCQSTFKWKFGNTATVQAVLQAVTQQDWKPFFDANYWGTAMPGK